MKKTLAILLALAMIFGLAACGGETTTTTTTTTEPTQTNTSTTTTTTTPTTTTPATTETTAPVRENEERYGGDIILAVSEVTSSMDPHFCGNAMVNYDWMRNIFEAPVVTGADGNVYPLICDYDLASDGLSLNNEYIKTAINAGETLGLVGESGCGKSITSLSIMRLLGSTARIEGRIDFCGTDILSLSKDAMRNIRGNKISMIFQDPMTSLNPVFTIGEVCPW